MSEIKKVSGKAIPHLLDDIDTDRIIPARYLRCVTFDGLGEHLFKDDRKQDPEHPFDKEHHQDASVLISGRNFGCGSSREHAPQALQRWGIDAVVAESFAEIFFGNCTSLGIPAVTCSRETLEKICTAIEADPHVTVTVDLETFRVIVADDEHECELPHSAHESLTTGKWDFLGLLLEAEDEIKATGEKIPYLNSFAN